MSNPPPPPPDRGRTLAVTCGDPGGIGPEVALRSALAHPPNVLLRLFGSHAALDDAAGRVSGAPGALADARASGRITVEDPGGPAFTPGRFGRPTAESGEIALRSLEAAVGACLDGSADALVTAPLSKTAVVMTGRPFTGQTEYLGQRTQTRRPVMAFETGALRVALLTTHIPLRRVALSLSPEIVTATIQVFTGALRERWGIAKPRLALCGLNPHAGEGGMFGSEEQRILEPGLKAAADSGAPCAGPIPADTAFHRAVGGEFDGVVACYHDQALIAVKTLGFLGAVELTLGLPFVRTSPAHGTAYDRAGKGTADVTSMAKALALAERLSAPRGMLFV